MALAGPDVVAELFNKLDEIEGPDTERPIVTIEYLADGSGKLNLDMARLGKIRATVSPEAWRLMRDTYLPAAMWACIHRVGPMRRLIDA
jgi:hypothetical protein